MTSEDKLDYIDAVKCLMNKEPITPIDAAPGVRSRFDDFSALHVNQTTIIHWTSNFFTWHRYYTWLYENALRNECGYNGTQPYWDWPSTDSIADHPLFDSSATSIGGNGESINHTTNIYIPIPDVLNLTITPGSGGGCVTDGPFANFNVSLGPHGAPMADGLQSDERCLTRDFRDWYLQDFLSYDRITVAMVEPDMQSFSTAVGSGDGALHSSGHVCVGGLQDDLWASPQDPYFFFHHAQMDRLWSLWQGLDQGARTLEVSDTLTIQNCKSGSPHLANI